MNSLWLFYAFFRPFGLTSERVRANEIVTEKGIDCGIWPTGKHDGQREPG